MPDPSLRRRSLLSALAAGGAAALLPRPAGAQGRFAGRELVMQVFGGPSQDVMREVVFAWAEKELGARVAPVPLLSAPAFARMKAEAQNPQIDLYSFSGGQETVAKAEGLSKPIAGSSRMAALPAGLRDGDGHWLAWGVIAQGILYRTDKIAAPPRSYADFFKPEYKGHVAFPHITNGYGMDFLVMLARANGGGEKNIDPGFEAMRRIKDASIFRAAADVQTQFAQNDVWIMPYDAASALRSAKMGLPIAFAAPAEGAPSVLLTACVAGRSRNADVAAAVIDRLLSPEVQVPLAREVGWAPTHPDVKLPPEVAANFPRLEQLVSLDRDTINANRAAWTERWNREIAA